MAMVTVFSRRIRSKKGNSPDFIQFGRAGPRMVSVYNSTGVYNMTLILEITDEQRKRLREKASKLGLDENSYLQRLIVRETSDSAICPTGETIGKDML